MKLNRDKVAKQAGVSTATVSRAFNKPNSVSPDARRKVLTAAQQLGYTPNKFASALARNATGRILFADCNKLAVHDESHKWFYASLYKSSLEAVLHKIEPSPYHLTIDFDGASDPQDYDAILLYDVDSPDQVQRYKTAGIPLVYGHHLAGFFSGNRVGVDNVAGSAQASSYLLNSGCRNIAYVTGALPQLNSHVARLEGFLKGLGPEKDNCKIIEVMVGPEGGRSAARQLSPYIKGGKIDGIGVVNDLTAFGLVQELLARGIRIPNDVSVIGFDNLPINDLLPFKLTTLDLRLEEIYARGAGMLLDMLSDSGKENREEAKVLFEPELIIGESV